MSNEQLVLMYQITEDKSYMNELIERNTDFIYKIIKGYNIDELKLVEQDDLFQEGCIGLMTAVEKYDFSNDKKAKFITYAFYWVKRAISGYIKNKKIYEDSLNEAIKDGESKEKIDFIEDSNNETISLEDQEFNKWLRENEIRLMNSELTTTQKEVVELFYGFDCKEHTVKEIAEILETNENDIIKYRQNALTRLRKTKFMRSLYMELRGKPTITHSINNPEKKIIVIENALEKYMRLFNQN